MAIRRLLACGVVAALAACETAPQAPDISVTQAGETAPVGVALPVGRNPAEGLTENDWGGEIPQSKPAAAVSEGGLGDVD